MDTVVLKMLEGFRTEWDEDTWEVWMKIPGKFG